MKEFVVTEVELDGISLLNTLSSGFFSAASAAGMFALTLWISAVMQGNLAPKAEALAQVGVAIGFILCIGFAIFGLCLYLKRRGILSQIKKESIPIDQMRGIVDVPQSGSPNAPIPDKASPQP